MLFQSIQATFRSTQFYVNKDDRRDSIKCKSFTQEASTLGLTSFSRLYDDACDVGIAVINSKNPSQKSYWYVAEEHRDMDNDVTHWTLYPCPESIRKYPKLNGYEMIIWND